MHTQVFRNNCVSIHVHINCFRGECMAAHMVATRLNPGVFHNSATETKNTKMAFFRSRGSQFSVSSGGLLSFCHVWVHTDSHFQSWNSKFWCNSVLSVDFVVQKLNLDHSGPRSKHSISIHSSHTKHTTLKQTSVIRTPTDIQQAFQGFVLLEWTSIGWKTRN